MNRTIFRGLCLVLLTGGSSVPSLTTSVAPSGGMLLGGTGVPVFGLIVGGDPDYSAEYSPTVSGGVIAGGTAPLTHVYNYTMNGGLKLGSFVFPRRTTITTTERETEIPYFPLIVLIKDASAPIYFTDDNYLPLPFEQRATDTWAVKVTLKTTGTTIYAFHN